VGRPQIFAARGGAGHGLWGGSGMLVSVRLLHTSDWHLGHSLHDLARIVEHERFLAWLLDLADREAIDAMLVTGDVFDASNPPASAERMWFGFLAELARRRPGIDVVVIGGNHDSAGRLDAPRVLLGGLGVHVVGGLARNDDGSLDLDRLIVPLHDARGRVAALCAAVPFLRPADLPAPVDDLDDPLVAGVAAVYREVCDAARSRLTGDQALVATGHCYVVGTELSQLSERRILGGNQHALPVEVFPTDVAYGALGHLHKAQRVGGRDHVRYAGSPIPLALGEARYRHQVVVAEIDGAGPATIRTIPVPRTVDILRVPASGAAPLAEVEAMLAALEPARTGDDPERPYLEVAVELAAPAPDLRRRLDAALVGRRPRLVKITACLPGDGAGLADRAPAPELKDVDPAEVFARRWQRDHDGEPPAELCAAFHELVEAVRRGEGEVRPRSARARVETERSKA
jgi:exonuclease SbcD